MLRCHICPTGTIALGHGTWLLRLTTQAKIASVASCAKPLARNISFQLMGFCRDSLAFRWRCSQSGAILLIRICRRLLVSDIPHEPHRRPHSGSRADPFMEFDLTAEVHRLQAETTWSTGQNARTLVKYDDLRVVLTALKASGHIPEHKTEGQISLHVLSGHLQVKALGRTFSLRAGGLLALDRGILHDVTALEDSAFIITIAWPHRE